MSLPSPTPTPDLVVTESTVSPVIPPSNPSKKRRPSLPSTPPKWLSYGICFFIAFIFGYLVCLPITQGGWFQVFTVEGASMEPTYQRGDKIIVFKADKYKVDDIVIYQSPANLPGCNECLIVHRLVDRNDDGTWVIKGDNNPANDPDWGISSSKLIGKVILNW